ncbi:MAG: DALR domain-containing protein, partial [Egibacteraceae bacterium]
AEKMAKSVGNVISLARALDRYGANVLRQFFLAAHYRSPVEFSEERLDEAAAAFDRWAAFVRTTSGLAPPDAGDVGESAGPEAGAAREAFRGALDDDLNTPEAHAALFDLASAGNRHLEAGRRSEAAALGAVVRELAGVLGYTFDDGEAAGAGLVAPLVEELLRLRAEARDRKEFATADAIRARLSELGIVVEDCPDGARWHLA